MITNRIGRRILSVGVAACAVTLVVSGCSGDESGDAADTADAVDSPGSSVVVSAEPTVSAEAASDGSSTPTDEPADASPEAPSSPDGFHPGGWGPITVGMTPDEVAALVSSQEELRPAGNGNLCSTSQVTTGEGPVYVTYKTGVVYGVSNSWMTNPTPGFATADGLAVGDPAAEITRIYPGASRIMTQGGEVYVITDPADPMSALSVTAPSGTVAEIRGGDAEFAKHFESCIDFSGGGG